MGLFWHLLHHQMKTCGQMNGTRRSWWCRCKVVKEVRSKRVRRTLKRSKSRKARRNEVARWEKSKELLPETRRKWLLLNIFQGQLPKKAIPIIVLVHWEQSQITHVQVRVTVGDLPGSGRHSLCYRSTSDCGHSPSQRTLREFLRYLVSMRWFSLELVQSNRDYQTPWHS
jgi:hypothetical protein